MAIVSGLLRSAFVDYLDDYTCYGGPSLDDVVTVGRGGRKLTLRQLTNQLWNCTNILPGCYCRLLQIQRGSTFAVGARAFVDYYGTPLPS